MHNGGGEAEWLTRKLRIDAKLRSLHPGWEIVPWREGLETSALTRHAVTEFPTANGPRHPSSPAPSPANSFPKLVSQDPTDEPAEKLLEGVKQTASKL